MNIYILLKRNGNPNFEHLRYCDKKELKGKNVFKNNAELEFQLLRQRPIKNFSFLHTSLS